MFPFEPCYLTAHHLYSPLLTAPPEMHSCSSELDQIISPGPSYLPQVDTVGNAVVCCSCNLKVWISSVVNVKPTTLFDQVTDTVKSFCCSPGQEGEAQTRLYINSELDISTILGKYTALYLSTSIFLIFFGSTIQRNLHYLTTLVTWHIYFDYTKSYWQINDAVILYTTLL